MPASDSRPSRDSPAPGFEERTKGSHHIFNREGVDEILNLQPGGSMPKPYQVKQVRRVRVQYKLAEVGQ